MMIDVREKEECYDAVQGSLNVPLGSLELWARAHSEQRDVPLRLYCQSGARAAYGTHLLQHLGFSDVSNLGGVEAARLYQLQHPE